VARVMIVFMASSYIEKTLLDLKSCT